MIGVTLKQNKSHDDWQESVEKITHGASVSLKERLVFEEEFARHVLIDLLIPADKILLFCSSFDVNRVSKQNRQSGNLY